MPSPPAAFVRLFVVLFRWRRKMRARSRHAKYIYAAAVRPTRCSRPTRPHRLKITHNKYVMTRDRVIMTSWHRVSLTHHASRIIFQIVVVGSSCEFFVADFTTASVRCSRVAWPLRTHPLSRVAPCSPYNPL